LPPEKTRTSFGLQMWKRRLTTTSAAVVEEGGFADLHRLHPLDDGPEDLLEVVDEEDVLRLGAGADPARPQETRAAARPRNSSRQAGQTRSVYQSR